MDKKERVTPTTCWNDRNVKTAGNMNARFRKTSMMKIVRGLVGLLVNVGLSGCELIGFPEWEWRQKLTIEVELPFGPIAASSVMAVKCGSSPQWLRGMGGGGLGCQIQGEAVSLAMAPGHVLFGLLTGAPRSTNYPDKVAYHVFFPDRTLTTVEERGDRLEREFRGEVRDLPRQYYPLLVTFTDINDPKTVQQVDPDNLAATFGPGVSLKRITLEITDEPVTEGKLESVLGWLDDLKKYRTDPNNPFTNTLSKKIGYLRSKSK